jgi:PRC-barrel domain
VSGLALGSYAAVAADSSMKVGTQTDGSVSVGDGAALSGDTARTGAASMSTDTGAGADASTSTGMTGDVATTGTKPPAVAGQEMATGTGAVAPSGVEISSNDLVGATVYDGNDEEIGEISAVLMDSASGATRVVVDVGGFLGIGEHPVALGLQDLTIATDADGHIDTVTVASTKDELEAMPVYEG